MGKYISKSAVVAEIEGRIKAIPRDETDKRLKAVYGNEAFVLMNLLSFINTLEVKEVDLEKEIDECLKKHNMLAVGKKDFTEIAKHFFELGLQARIDKELVEEVYSHIDSIKDTADRMTSGNFMHNRAAIKFSANTIAKVLELIGLKAQKGE